MLCLVISSTKNQWHHWQQIWKSSLSVLFSFHYMHYIYVLCVCFLVLVMLTYVIKTCCYVLLFYCINIGEWFHGKSETFWLTQKVELECIVGEELCILFQKTIEIFQMKKYFSFMGGGVLFSDLGHICLYVKKFQVKCK